MKQYINKGALLAEIEKLIGEIYAGRPFDSLSSEQQTALWYVKSIMSSIENLEVKEDDKYEIPDIKTKDTIEVSSRMKYIDEDLKPIAEFIMNYASWNLHKDEWNQPVLEVPLFRVLDALAQRGKPYCCR